MEDPCLLPSEHLRPGRLSSKGLLDDELEDGVEGPLLIVLGVDGGNYSEEDLPLLCFLLLLGPVLDKRSEGSREVSFPPELSRLSHFELHLKALASVVNDLAEGCHYKGRPVKGICTCLLLFVSLALLSQKGDPPHELGELLQYLVLLKLSISFSEEPALPGLRGKSFEDIVLDLVNAVSICELLEIQFLLAVRPVPLEALEALRQGVVLLEVFHIQPSLASRLLLQPKLLEEPPHLLQ